MIPAKYLKVRRQRSLLWSTDTCFPKKSSGLNRFFVLGWSCVIYDHLINIIYLDAFMKLLPFVFKESIFWCYISFLCRTGPNHKQLLLFMVGSPFKKLDRSRGLDTLRTCLLVMNYIQMLMFIFRHSGKTQHSNEHYEQSLIVWWYFVGF